MIRVIYRDGKEDLVTQKFLDILLFMGEVQMFQRDEDWAVVGVDPLRAESRQLFDGQDRRLHQQVDLAPLQMCC
ncbi:hypothetical protein SAMN02745165_01062 [Malonomonas rubra DSM 5091]|uniref:Uncharacterized protein n=1 Tax=Malonomonas rubra DSM 5091 TaxID=1122189 RepID=A0A1M6EWN9_MALRU|nr:hypothetical protein [Malonomonas rubra]SHI89791.1 hypothetical protein SAMN02745165_01062 [Malonomonas rubra DSM 5091]